MKSSILFDQTIVVLENAGKIVMLHCLQFVISDTMKSSPSTPYLLLHFPKVFLPYKIYYTVVGSILNLKCADDASLFTDNARGLHRLADQVNETS